METIHQYLQLGCLTAGLLLGGTLFAAESSLTAELPSLPTWPGDISRVVGQNRAFLSEDGSEVIVVLERGSELEEVRVALRNRIHPGLSVAFEERSRGKFLYRYDVRNLAESADEIGIWSVVVPLEAQVGINHNAPFEMRWGGAAYQAQIADTLTPGAEPGRYVSWMATKWEGRENRPTLTPGASNGGYEIVSDFKPGFAIAHFGHIIFPTVDPDWPEAVHREVGKFWESLLRRRSPLVSFGPTFALDERPDAMAGNFIEGMDLLAEAQELSLNSPFIRSLMDALILLREESARNSPLVIDAEPEGDWELQISKAVGLSFGPAVLQLSRP